MLIHKDSRPAAVAVRPPGGPQPAPVKGTGRTGWGIAVAVAAVFTLAFPTSHHMTMVLQARFAAEAGMPARPVVPWVTFVIVELPAWTFWLLVSPGIRLLCRRFPLIGRNRARHFVVHLLAGVVAVLGVVAVVVTFRRELGPVFGPPLSFGKSYLLGVVDFAPYFLTVFAAIDAAFHAALYFRAYQTRALHAAHLETQLANAQLDVLRMQLQPHFLFNTLNTISALIFKDRRAALRTVGQLGELLRRSIESVEAHEVALHEELSFLDQYIAIQRVRFEDRLQVTYEIADDVADLLVPRLLLQPLVENSIRHGIQVHEGPGRIWIRASREGDSLRLEVADDGRGLRSEAPADGAFSGGVGLRNTRARLECLYGEQFSFSLESRGSGGVAVRIEVPARVESPGHAMAPHP